MFKNLKAEIARKGMNNCKVALAIGMNSRTFNKKMAGKTEFNRKEMELIKKALGEDFTLDYLFARSDQDAQSTK